jgi:hypothetical protein
MRNIKKHDRSRVDRRLCLFISSFLLSEVYFFPKRLTRHILHYIQLELVILFLSILFTRSNPRLDSVLVIISLLIRSQVYEAKVGVYVCFAYQ